MTELRTEEEQIEVIKNWWKENGRSTVFGVLAAIAIVLGWRGWQQSIQNAAEQASVLYQNMQAAIVVQPGQTLDEEKRKTAEHLAGQLKTDFGDLAYAQYAALWLAKSAVETGNLSLAQTELEWVLERKPMEGIARITELRLARVLLAQDKAEEALKYLNKEPAEGFQASYYEVKGDVYEAMGRTDEAREAYTKAGSSSQGGQRPILTMKLDNLAAEDN
ncbi:tetratricopeptide repeat protein [Motiliproteus sp. MSK22-1]|uniref:YfgM family protein n=1 Tax=Motiliproteus sp. MSK22-1 TaxID=1897630 RepID=UPI0009F91D79|nr:tetratricopeptide repeat protein [Motiliproteus sp. MSK22-1]